MKVESKTSAVFLTEFAPCIIASPIFIEQSSTSSITLKDMTMNSDLPFFYLRLMALIHSLISVMQDSSLAEAIRDLYDLKEVLI